MKVLRTITVSLLLGFVLAVAATATQTIMLVPNGSDDTAAVQAALDKCVKLTTACTIRFARGEFFVSPVIADNFRGSIIGAGEDKTILTLRPIQLKDGFFFEPWSVTNPQPQMFTFRGGDITISGMTMRAIGANPFPPYCYFPGVCFTELQSFIVITALPGSTARTNSRIEHVSLVADEGAVNGSNTNNAVVFGGLFLHPKMEYGGTHILRHNRFDHCHVFMLGAKDVKFVAQDNVFRKSGIALDAWQLDNSEVIFNHNDVEATWTALGAAQLTFWDPDGWIPQRPSSWLIANNHVRITGNEVDSGEGIFVIDAFQILPVDQRKKMLNALIFNNKVEMSTGSRNAIGLYGTKNTLVTLNHVAGEGQWGIAAHGANTCGILNNDVQGFNAQLAQIFLAGTGEAMGGDTGITALYPDTSYCLVVTSSPADQVVDEGVNNIIFRPHR